jgi:hypothetical protein
LTDSGIRAGGCSTATVAMDIAADLFDHTRASLRSAR